MRSIVKLAPLAVGLAIFAVVVAVLLNDQTPLGTWLLAAFLLGHGLVHMMFVVPSARSSWRGSGRHGVSVRRRQILARRRHVLTALFGRWLVIGLVAVVVVGYGLAALATVGILLPASWWPLLVIVATSASAALMLISCHPAWSWASRSTCAPVAAIVAAWSPSWSAARRRPSRRALLRPAWAGDTRRSRRPGSAAAASPRRSRTRCTPPG